MVHTSLHNEPPETNRTDPEVMREQNILISDAEMIKSKLYEILVDKHSFKVCSPQTVAGILALVDKTVDKWHLQIKLKGGAREILDPNEEIDLTREGIERFETVPKECSNG